jgi:hypothetical protein
VSGFGTDMYAILAAYRDVLVRIGDQGANFDHSEAVDVLSRIVECHHFNAHQELDMLQTVIRAAAAMELDDEAEQEIDVTTAFLNGSGVSE